MQELTPDSIRRDFERDLASARDARALAAVRDRYLSRKKGLVSALLRQLGKLPPAERPSLGEKANALKQQILARLAEAEERLERAPAARPIDVTLPGRQPPLGKRHPVIQVREEIEEIFMAMGYEVAEGPELETDYYNFEALNMPPDHPARDMQDTFYLPGNLLLRTHTSSVQIRYMLANRPPLRLIAPGKVFRRDNDLTHSPMFHQVEGLVVDRRITLGDLKGTLEAFVRALFGKETRTRFRPSYFPYTEPSAEMDIGCNVCSGSGCRVCKSSGWLEILGSGMVHPAVFEAVGYDPAEWSGFAFGMGIDRVAMMRYGVDDIRLFFENDLRFLNQFPG